MRQGSHAPVGRRPHTEPQADRKARRADRRTPTFVLAKHSGDADLQIRAAGGVQLEDDLFVIDAWLGFRGQDHPMVCRDRAWLETSSTRSSGLLVRAARMRKGLFPRRLSTTGAASSRPAAPSLRHPAGHGADQGAPVPVDAELDHRGPGIEHVQGEGVRAGGFDAGRLEAPSSRSTQRSLPSSRVATPSHGASDMSTAVTWTGWPELEDSFTEALRRSLGPRAWKNTSGVDALTSPSRAASKVRVWTGLPGSSESTCTVCGSCRKARRD